MNTTNDASQPAVAGQVDCQVRPRAWAIFVDNGNARMWSTLQPHIQKLADAEGLQVTPLYDQSALDAAVAAERERQPAQAPCALTWAIQRLNSTPYAMTKDECVEMLRGLRSEIQALVGPNAKLNGGPPGPSV